MNMFKPTKAKTVPEYLAAIPKERKELVLFLHDFIRKAVPKLKVHFAYNMIGYGSFDYDNHRGQILPWPTIGLANQKQHVSIYVCSIDNGKYLAESFKQELGKVKVGKSCIAIKKLEDIDLPTFKKVLQLAAKNPGLR